MSIRIIIRSSIRIKEKIVVIHIQHTYVPHHFQMKLTLLQYFCAYRPTIYNSMSSTYDPHVCMVTGYMVWYGYSEYKC